MFSQSVFAKSLLSVLNDSGCILISAVLSRSSQCSTTDVTKAVVCTIMSVG